MFAPSGLRGRNVEDVHELEEKGLLMSRQSSGTGSDRGVGVRGLSLVEKEKEKERDRAKEKGKGKDKGRLEMVAQDEDGPVGLNNRRDRNAFILLVVLCEWDSPCFCPFSPATLSGCADTSQICKR
jgi:hypothetical protein